MLQDSIMEKNKIRSVQSSSKGVVTDKKNQDGTNGKYWPKSARRREPNSSQQTKNDQRNNKPIQPRNRYTDKRPKPRSFYNYPCQMGGKENARLEEVVTQAEAELGSVFVPGSKKQSLNHLINFHYEPRGEKAQNVNTRNYGQGYKWMSTQKHKYNKEQFLQANCQFIVNSEGDYTTYLNNPDALVDWDMVEQIHVQVSEFPSCPICLYSPVAAKMTRCGHVYCWSCVLHYLTLSENAWHKCPICYESIYKKDLKSVVAIPHKAFNSGEHIKLRLMKREKGSFTAIPVEENHITRNTLLNINEKNVDTVYSKLLLAGPEEVLTIIDREKKELEFQLNDDENLPEKCFIEQAVALLNEREKIILNRIQNKVNIQEFKIFNNDRVPIEKHVFKESENENDNNRYRYESTSSEGVCDSESGIRDNLIIDEKNNISNNLEGNNVKNYYFYQATDGQHIYLHSINIKMLEHQYGALENCPVTISGRILEKEGGSMTEELRKRLRCLQHLPITCQFEIAEIQLGVPTISKETLEAFHDQLEIRRKRRQRRARDEKRREKRIAEEENRMMGKYPEANVNFNSLRQFPECGFEDINQMPSLSPRNISTPTSERSVSPINSHEELAGPSFAKMLTTGKPKEPTWPSLNTNKVSEEPKKFINVTGSRQTARISSNRRASDSEPEPEDYVPAPTFNQSFSDAIALAFEKSSISGNNGEGGSGSKGKKKKNKQKILFTTSMMYPCNNEK